MWKKTKALLLRFELLIFILCLVSFLRLPSLMEPYWYGDEGIYLTLGNGIRHGLTLYKDIHDNKPPGIYLLAAVAGSLFWFRLILLFWNLGSITVFYLITEKILKPVATKPLKLIGISFPRPNLVTVATLLFGLLPFLAEGNIANGEIFMLLPTLLGFAFLLRMKDEDQKKQKLIWSALAGLSFSLAFLIKVPAVFDAFAAGLFFFLLVPNLRRSLFSWAPWVFAATFLLPIIFSIAYYSTVGAGPAYINAALLQNVGYLSSWTTGTQQANLGKTGLMGRGIILIFATLVLAFSQKWLESGTIFVLLWFAYALFGGLLSERPYPHYLIQVVPPLSLLMVLIGKYLSRLQKLSTKINLGALSLALVALAIAFVTFKFWNYSLPPYFQNYFNFMNGRISREQYFTFFDKTLPEQYYIASYITAYTTNQDRIFIWADLPSIYALTRRLPVGRFTAAYHVKDFNGYNETYAAILQKTPKFILIDKRLEPFPHLEGILMDEYVAIYNSPIFSLYRRLNP